MKSLQGQFLIASPHLPDDNFFRSVVLMVQHDTHGAMGLVLNRPCPLSVRDVWSKIGEGETQCLRPVYLGGPIEGPLMLIHLESRFCETEIVPGLYFATQKESLRGVITESDAPFRLFSGYSGWGSGQLEGEMQAGAWLTLPATLEYVFETDDEALWKRVADAVGRKLMSKVLGLKKLPEKPWLN